MVARWRRGRVTVFATSRQIKVQVAEGVCFGARAEDVEAVAPLVEARRAGSSEAFDLQAAERQSAAHVIPAPHLAHTAVKQATEARVCKDISGQGVDWLCLGSGRETRWDTEVSWLLCQLPTRSWPQAV